MRAPRRNGLLGQGLRGSWQTARLRSAGPLEIGRVDFPTPPPGVLRSVRRLPASAWRFRRENAGGAFRLPDDSSTPAWAVGCQQRNLAVGTNLEQLPDAQTDPSEGVRWIGRDRPSFERVVSPEPVVTLPGLQTPAARLKWPVMGAVVALALIALLAWKLLGGAKTPPTMPADRGAIPLVSVI